MYPDGELNTKNKIKSFMRTKNTAITPEIVTKYIYRHMPVAHAELILDEMVENDEKIVKSEIADGYVYYYKYKKKKRYY